ncbi:MAG TPA: ankyrin repeat domain-containing protein, partial [Treponemataceae bacterium]|nr:ankyrin repeat domain-containing protein [Treponemataceae bacterium]
MNTSRRIKPVILKVAVSLMLFLAINIPSFAENSGEPATRDIYEAIRANDIRSLRLLLEMDNVEYYNHSEAYPLLYAIRVSNTQAVQILLPYYSNTTLIKIDPFDENSKTILEEAESQNSPEIRRLIYNRVYSELNQDENIELLYLYLISDFEAVRQGVISKKIDIKNRKKHQKSLLHLCADKRDYNNRWFPIDVYLNEDNKVKLARFLIDQGIDLDLVDDSRDTALHMAIEYGYNALAALLIEAGAAVNGTDQTSRSPLEQALQYKNTIICEKLVKAGANLNEMMDYRRSLLAKSIDDEQFEFAKILIHGGADVNAKGEKGYSPLYEACDESNLELCTLLLEKGADVNSKNGKYDTPPLPNAIYPDNYELVELLLSHGADANGKDSDGQNALFNISSTNDMRIVQILLDSGADVNALDCNGSTPVLYAAGFGRLDQLELFTKYKGNFLVKDNEGNTAIHAAVKGAVTKEVGLSDFSFLSG